MTLKLHRPLSIPERVREAGGVRVLVLSEAEALQFVPDVPTLYISITDPGRTKLPEFTEEDNEHILHVARLAFHDREVQRFGFELMSEEQARLLWATLTAYRKYYQQVVVHCWAGRCRSSAVAASIAGWLGDEGAEDFYVDHFEPNTHVYHTMQAARH